MNPYALARPLLYRLDAEKTHDHVIAGLASVSNVPSLTRALERIERFDDPRLRSVLFGRELASPIAVAAGLDKNGVAVPALNSLGFAFVEVGTVTLQPQSGNDRPRVFRLPEDRALINRMGFPGKGVERAKSNLTAFVGRGLFALNVGPNRDRIDQAAEDVVAVVELLASLDPLYVVLNVSSPNTARLRALQGKEALRRLISDVLEGRSPVAAGIPLLVKIAPDLADEELDQVLQVVSDLGVAGIVATNTTTSRPDSLRETARSEQGGLSGAPLRDRSTRMIARIRGQAGAGLVVVGAGGVFDGADALDKIGAGATAVQTYTGLIYEGPGLAKRIKQGMVNMLERQGIASLDSIRGTGYRAPRW